MVLPKEFVKALNENELGPIMGVPCSLLAPLLGYILDNPLEIEQFLVGQRDTYHAE